MTQSNSTDCHGVLAGELVEVRSREEILATLDENGKLNSMPFMPEMLQYCGKRFRVFKRSDKTCDNIKQWSMRRVKDAVHLTGIRCDGSSHGNCDAGCLIFWNEAWLKGVKSDLVSAPGAAETASTSPHSTLGAVCTEQRLRESVVRPDPASPGGTIYMCQATELREFTSHLYWWDIGQYFRDIRSGNLRRGIAGTSKSEEVLEGILGFLEVVRSLIITAFNKLQDIRDGVQYPHIQGTLDTTPTMELNLQSGEFVTVRSKEEILATLDRNKKNRGLLFDSEMVRYCGGTFRVLKRVNQIVDERTGKVMKMKSPCIILEGVACASEYHRLCPRAIYHYWREAWLRRPD